MQSTLDAAWTKGLRTRRNSESSPGILGLSLLMTVGLLTGCSSIHTEVGHPLTKSSTQFVEGTTQVRTVLRELGPPHQVSALPDGFAMLYEYSLVKEFQFGISLKCLRMPYFKLITGDSKVSENTQLLVFDQQGVLKAQDSEAWSEKLGAGGALQWITSVHGLSDTAAFREVPDQMDWGQASLQPPAVTLNRESDLRQGSNGLEQRMAPVYVGQSTLEMAKPKSIRFKRKKTRW